MKFPKWITNSIVTALRASVSASYSLSDPALTSLFRFQDDDTGIYVNEETALSLSSVYRAVKLLSDSVAMLPLITYKRIKVNGGTGKEKDIDNPIYFLLKEQPNQWQTPFDFNRIMMIHLLLRGNFYAEIVVDGRGNIQLIPLEPDRVTPFMAPDGKRAYYYQPLQGTQRTILQSEMYHVMNMSTTDGLKGVGVIENHSRTFGMSIGAEKHGARLYRNGARPGGVLETPNKRDDEAQKNLTDSWQEAHGGVDNSNKVAVLYEGMQFKPIAMTPEDVQYIETRKFQVTDIARIFGVPSHMLNDLERATFSNIEHQSQEYVTTSLLPWLINIEQCTNRDLLSIEARMIKGSYVKFNVNMLLRGDSKTRAENASSELQNGTISINEAREREDLNPIENGDKYYHQLNMVEVGKEPAVEDPEPEPDEDEIITDTRSISVKKNGNGVGHE